MAREGLDIPDLGGNASDDEVTEMLQETAGDLSRDEITQKIETMNDDLQDALVALFWIGRGDYAATELDEAMAQARRHDRAATPRYLLAQPLLADFLLEGMLAFGHDCGDAEEAHFQGPRD